MYQSIVVGTDGSETAAMAVARAAELAATTNSALTVVSAYRPVPESRLLEAREEAPDELKWMINPHAEVERILAEAKAAAEAKGATKVETVSVDGVPEDAILDTASKLGAGLIVVGSLGMSGAKRFLMGSVPNRVAHHAPCDVLIVRTD